jgi:hypothetical protein
MLEGNQARNQERNQIVARRIGRIVFGGVLLAGVAYLVAAACATSGELLAMHDVPSPHDPQQLHAARIISFTWLAAAAAGFVAWRIAARVPLVRQPDWLFAESLMAPTLGIALLLPITLHMPVGLLLADSVGFDSWVVTSVWVTSLTHCVFAGACTLRVHELVTGRPARSPRSIYAATVTTSCIPFILAFAIPPVIVAITALPFLPLLRVMETLVARERREIADAPHPLPHAIVRPPPDVPAMPP